MKMNKPSDSDWKIASSLASSIGEKGGFPNAKLIFESSVMDEDASEEDRTLPRRFADHTYRDFSTYIKDGGKVLRHKKSESNFPARLHAMLSDEKYTHMISWMVSYHTEMTLIGGHGDGGIGLVLARSNSISLICCPSFMLIY